MTERKNLKITADTYELLREQKRDMETWDSYLRRIAGVDADLGKRRRLVQSTVKRFIDDRARVEIGETIPKDRVYDEFQTWKLENEIPTEIPRNEFGRAIQNLDDVLIEGVQRRVDGERVQMYANITFE